MDFSNVSSQLDEAYAFFYRNATEEAFPVPYDRRHLMSVYLNIRSIKCYLCHLRWCLPGVFTVRLQLFPFVIKNVICENYFDTTQIACSSSNLHLQILVAIDDFSTSIHISCNSTIRKRFIYLFIFAQNRGILTLINGL